MSECQATLLSDRALVQVTGPAATTFLQGLITNDIDKAKSGSAIHAGLLTPQGKILFDFFLVPTGDGFLLDVTKVKAGELLQRLGFYKLRARVEIAKNPSFIVAAAWGASTRLPHGAVVYTDPRLPALGQRILARAGTCVGDLGCTVACEGDYHIRRIELGVPEGGRDYMFGDAFPHEALFDQLNGVDFKKGCFVGQEVVSRMEHRGTSRKRVVGVEGEGPLPPSGTDITAAETSIGTLGSVSGTSGLALLRLDRAEEAKATGQPLRAGDVTIAFSIPTWARFKSPTPIAP
jgi:tRNA-modifying protein YgfZ